MRPSSPIAAGVERSRSGCDCCPWTEGIVATITNPAPTLSRNWRRLTETLGGGLAQFVPFLLEQFFRHRITPRLPACYNGSIAAFLTAAKMRGYPCTGTDSIKLRRSGLLWLGSFFEQGDGRRTARNTVAALLAPRLQRPVARDADLAGRDPSIVTIFFPAAARTGVTHETMARPSRLQCMRGIDPRRSHIYAGQLRSSRDDLKERTLCGEFTVLSCPFTVNRNCGFGDSYFPPSTTTRQNRTARVSERTLSARRNVRSLTRAVLCQSLHYRYYVLRGRAV